MGNSAYIVIDGVRKTVAQMSLEHSVHTLKNVEKMRGREVKYNYARGRNEEEKLKGNLKESIQN